MDLRDSKLRLRVQSLTQLRRTPREQAVAIYGFVKTLPLMMAPAYRVMTARDCLEARRAGWYGKSTLLIALLRATGLPARLRVLGLSGEVLRGLVKTHLPFYLPVVEVWLDDRWVLFDGTRMAPIDRLIRVGTGRDAKDVAFATIFGAVVMTRKELTIDQGDTPVAASADATPPALSLV